MQTTATRSNWSKIRSALWLGIPLGLLQIAMAWFGLTGLLQIDVVGFGPVSGWGWPAFVLGALCSLLLPAIAGIHAARQGAEETEGARAGRRVGCVSFIVCTLPVIILFVGALTSTPQPNPPNTGGYGYAAASALIGGFVVVLFLITLFNGLGVVVAYLGGFLGWKLGQRYKEDNHALHGH